MKKELFEIGKTVDSAIDSACEKLGCSREDCEWEIIDLPKKGFFGLKNIPAKVRVSIEFPEEKPKTLAASNLEGEKKPQQTAKPQEQKQAKPRQYDTGSCVNEKKEKKEPQQPCVTKKSEPVATGQITEKEAIARDYISDVLTTAGLNAEYIITREHGGSCINIIGEGLGMIIGRRGETLDAIQYLAGLAANRGEGEYLRLTVDCGNYRLKRQGTLEELAKKLANQVLRTNVSKTLEPMNPFERRIIHATVSEIEGVSSSSVGEEPNRRVIITSPAAKPAPKGGYRSGRDPSRSHYGKGRSPRRDGVPRGEDGEATRDENTTLQERTGRGGYRDKRGRDNRGDGRRDNKRPRQTQTAPQTGAPKQTPESESTLGISFGKIDL